MLNAPQVIFAIKEREIKYKARVKQMEVLLDKRVAKQIQNGFEIEVGF